MTLRHLNIFICVCELLNMTKTAEKLKMTQPAVSQAIAELEDYYNVKLFERLGRKIYLTTAGKKLFSYALHAVSFNNEMFEKMREFSDFFTLRIGASITVGSSVLLSILHDINIKYPNNKVFSIIDNTTKLEKMLLEDKIDIALVEGNIKSDYLNIKEFMDDELVVIVSKNHNLANCQSVDKNELSQEKFFVREVGSGTRELFEKVMNENNISWFLAGEFNNAEAIKQAVNNGLGISVISKLAVEKEVESGMLKIITIPQLNFKRKFNVVYHKNKYLSESLKEIVFLTENLQL